VFFLFKKIYQEKTTTFLYTCGAAPSLRGYALGNRKKQHSEEFNISEVFQSSLNPIKCFSHRRDLKVGALASKQLRRRLYKENLTAKYGIFSKVCVPPCDYPKDFSVVLCMIAMKCP